MKKSLFKIMLFASLIVLGASGSEAASLQDNQSTKLLHDGQMKLHLLSDGNSPGKASIIVNASEDEYEKYLPDGTFTGAVNAFLIRTNEKTILVDTGYGKRIFNNLEYLGVKQEDIDIVLLTHMHGDHISGLLQNGRIAFPKAQIYVAQKEFDYWQDKPAAEFLQPYAGKINYFDPGQLENGGREILPGIFAIAAYGHTPGHTMYLLKDQNKEILLWGDITHVTRMQVPVPQIFVTYDVDSTQAVTTREQVIAYAAEWKILVTGAHIEYPSLISIQADGEHYSYAFIE